jgi:hypothetical protein
LEELETTWSLDDMYRAIAMIEVKAAWEADAVKQAGKGNK